MGDIPEKDFSGGLQRELKHREEKEGET